MSNNYTTFKLRGGTREEHLAGGGLGFVGAQREVTVDTTDNTLRVHDGITVGGHRLMKSSDDIQASQIIFNDGESLQYKLDTGSLTGGGVNPPVNPGQNKPTILAIDVKNPLSNGTATASYFVSYDSDETLKHEISINNGKSFITIQPNGENPFEYAISNLILGQNLCAFRVSIGELSDTKYFIVEIPSSVVDTAPEIVNFEVSEITATSFNFKYTIYDKEGDDIVRHHISLDNGFTYRDIYPVYIDGRYEATVYGLLPETLYYCRFKVATKNMESMTYGFNVLTIV